MRREGIQELTMIALLVALIVMFTLTGIGFLDFGGIFQFQIVHIPVIIGVLISKSWKGPVALGLAMGVASWYTAMISAAWYAPIFKNPLVSVLPRVLFALIGYYIFKLLKTKIAVYPAGVAAALISTVLHSTLVFLAILLTGNLSVYYDNSVSFGQVMTIFFGVALLIESIIAAIIAPPAYKAVLSYMGEE